jgi:hypothetical protein
MAKNVIGFLNSAKNLTESEKGVLNSSKICSLTENLTAHQTWAVCFCNNLTARSTSFSYTFNVFFLRYAPPSFRNFAFYYEMVLYDIYPKAGSSQGGTR